MINQIELETKVFDQPREENKRRLDFSGVKNFRDLGGYKQWMAGVSFGESFTAPINCIS